ncbi:MAG: penicillin-binding protein 2 [Chitinispirillaceae bacterium]|nr:penicillin-binding protein 2 [Chitinispirillaceae bacterium]
MSFVTHLQDELRDRNRKSVVLVIALGLLFSILVLRLVYLQVFQASVNIQISKENSMRLRVIVPPRGCMYDRNGEMLARNRPSYSLCVLPSQLKKKKEVINRLCAIRDSSGIAVFDSADLSAIINKAYARRFDLTRIKEDVSFEIISIIEEHSMELPGVVVEAESRREYTLGDHAFHVLGYMGEIPESEFDTLKKRGYYYGDLIGKSGIERQYESNMRGVCGREYIEVNAHGKSLGPIPNIPRIEPIPGNNLYLTLDARLQREAAEAFPDSLKGAVVALDPRNGEVLIMFSSPSVDPNIFSMAGSERTKNWSMIAVDTTLPLNNRATDGTYAPGSTFKLVSALTGLEKGVVSSSSRMKVPCKGSFRFGNRIAHCWKETGHGSFTLIEAIQQSCNIYFYQLGLLLGDVSINRYAAMLGLGSATGIDLPTEKEGWISGKKAYNKRFKSRGWVWTKGLVLDLAIGQAQVATPLQLALMAGGLGDGEVLWIPYLLKEERNRDGIVVRQYYPSVADSLKFRLETIETIHAAMRQVVEPGGTGGRSAVKDVPVGGKTGSAQNPHGEKTHALFVACAPVDDPVIAIAVVVENAGHGGSIAAPISGQILRYFFTETDEGRIVAARCRDEAEQKKAKRTSL